MPAKHDKITRQLIERFFDFCERKLWLRFSDTHTFFLDLPSHPHGIMGCIMGQAGESHGLFLFLGPTARDDADPERRQRADAEDEAGLDILSASLDVMGELMPDSRRVLEMGGFEAGEGERAPLFMAKPPHAPPRAPKRAEQKTLLFALEGILRADDRGAFVPHDARESKPTLRLAVKGTLKDPKLETSWLPPHRAAASAAPPSVEPIEIPKSIAKLRIRDETWLVGFRPLPLAVEDSEAPHCLLILDEEEDQILALEQLPSFDLQAAAVCLFRVMKGERRNGFRKGLPSVIDFESRALFFALEEGLDDIGIDCLFAEDGLPMLDQAYNGLFEHLGLSAPEPSAPTGELGRWKQIDDEAANTLLQVLDSSKRRPKAAAKRYFGPEGFAVVPEELQEMAQIAFMEWWICSHRARAGTRTIAELALERRGLSSEVRAVIEARIAGHASIHRVVSSEAGSTLELEDVIGGTRSTVHDRQLSLSAGPGDFLPLKLYPAGPFTFAMIAGPGIPARYAERAVDYLHALGTSLTPDHAAEKTLPIGRLWPWLADRADDPAPKPTNSHGEPLELFTATFQIEDLAAVEAALRKRDDIDHDSEEGLYRWLIPAREGWFGDEVTAATLSFLGDELLVDVNSRPRLEAARQWIEALPGVRFLRVTEREFDLDTPDTSLPTLPDEETPAEVQEAIARIIHSHAMKWLDEKLPTLGNRTPRQHAKSSKGRQEVARMIRTMPASQGPGGMVIEPPREEMLRALGLEGE